MSMAYVQLPFFGTRLNELVIPYMGRRIFFFALFFFPVAFPTPSRGDLQKPQQMTLLLTLPDDHPAHQKIVQRVQTQFREWGIKTVVKSFATQYDLSQALTLPENSAVFWLSHGSELIQSGAVSLGGSIQDSLGANVAPVFTLAHSHLKFLAVISCWAKLKLETLLGGPDFGALQLYAAEGPTEALSGVEEALKHARSALNLERSSGDLRSVKTTLIAKAAEKVLVFKMTRRIPVDAKEELVREVRVQVKQNVIAVFPRGKPGEFQTREVPLPVDNPRWSNLSQICVDSGLDHSPSHLTRGLEPVLGDFSFFLEGSSYQWEKLRFRNGKAIGHTKNLYLRETR